MSFFLPKKRQDLPREKKRKRFNVSGRRPRAAGGEDPESGGAGGQRDVSAGQEEILSDASDVEGRPDAGYESDSDEERETAEAKRLRLAKKYLEEIENQERERLGQEEDRDGDHLSRAVNLRLKRDDLEESGKLKRLVASGYEKSEAELVDSSEGGVRLFRDHKVHKSPLTCLAVAADGELVMSGCKDGGLVLWRISMADVGGGSAKDLVKVARVIGGKKGCEDQHRGHCRTVNAVAISSDNKFMVSGDDANLIHVWQLSKDQKELEKVHTFKGHRAPVSGLSFRKGTHTLYSSSHDRSVKVWNLDEMMYIETLFGHQDKVTGIDAGLRERAITSGGTDGSVRVWKIVEESQLVFNAPSPNGASAASVDSVKLLNEESFVTCGEDGHLSLWTTMKKKPQFTVREAHGLDPANNEPRWISALATLHNTDLVASGSCDGRIRLWKCSDKFHKLMEVSQISTQVGATTSTQGEEEAFGFVNALAFHPDGNLLLAAVGQEHRLGRFWRHKKAKNGIVFIPLKPDTERSQELVSFPKPRREPV